MVNVSTENQAGVEPVKAPTPARWRSWRRIFAYSVLAGFLIGLLTSASIVWDGLSDDIHSADVAIVLGAGVQTNGEPTRGLRARLDKAIELYHHKFIPKILVSGGMENIGFLEADVMERYLVSKGIPPEAILTEGLSHNTFENAQNSAKIMVEHKMHSAIIVTQYFHIKRSCLACRRSGIENLYSAHADLFESSDAYSIAREVLAYYVYFVRTYTRYNVTGS